MKSPETQIWAYLHEELSSEQKETFENALENDASLREEFESVQATHNDLQEIMPLLENEDPNDDLLVEKLMADWKAENPEYADEPVKPSHRKILTFALPLVAAAAVQQP